MKRRTFIASGLCAGLGAAHQAYASQTPKTVCTVDPAQPGRTVPNSFIGLSYELAQLTEPTFFSATNTSLVAFFRRLSSNGILRIGGNTSEFCWFMSGPTKQPPKLHIPSGDLSTNWMPHRLFAIEPVAIDNLQGFLAATGWKAIYGINFGNSNPTFAADEAQYVRAKLGDHLLYFQIGNEPDFYRDSNNGTRPAGWGFDDYVREWVEYADAITARVPDARFGGPDTGASSDWVTQFGTAVSPKLGTRLVSLTGHYYAEGPPDDPAVTTERLLRGDPKVPASTAAIVQVADAHNLTYRMTEGNSCYRGGKPGMSNAFVATLWAADYLLELATLGCAGVNLHGGKSQFLSAGLGDHNPGLKVAKNTNTKRANGFYTPISSEDSDPIRASPVYYGMIFAGFFAGATVLKVESEPIPLLKLYAAKRQHHLLVGVINKSGSKQSIKLKLCGNKIHSLSVLSLSAPALDATSDVTFGQSSIADETASWKPRTGQLFSDGGVFHIDVPAASALILQGA
jgi:hypothetical protein